MTERTDNTLHNAARSVQALADDIQHGTEHGSMGARIYATLGAMTEAAHAVKALAEDLCGNPDVSTTGTLIRNTLRAVINAATSIEVLADDLRGHQGSFSKTTGTELRAALKRIGSKS